MYYFGIFVVTLFAVVLARPSTDLVFYNPPTTEGSASDLSNFCFFGKYPSTLCKQKCSNQNAEPFCNQDTRTCDCKPHEEEEGSRPDSEGETNDDDGHSWYYIIDISSLFGCGNGTYTSDNDTDTVTPEGDSHTTRPSYADEISGWAFQHTLALLIIVLLCVLIMFEFYSCLKKRKGKIHMETIFKPNSVSNKE